LTREHVLPNWLEAMFPGIDEREFATTWTDNSAPRHQFMTQHPLRVVTKEVCARCNNGWMSQLEESFKPTMLLFMGAGDEEYSPNWFTIARWAIKTAMVRLTLDTLHLPYPPADLETIQMGTELPADWYVWIGDANYYGSYHRLTVATDPDNPPLGAMQMTLEVGGLLMVVVYASPNMAAFFPTLSPVLVEEGAAMVYPVQMAPAIAHQFNHEEVLQISDLMPQWMADMGSDYVRLPSQRFFPGRNAGPEL
jgi:hypothetical protein